VRRHSRILALAAMTEPPPEPRVTGKDAGVVGEAGAGSTGGWTSVFKHIGLEPSEVVHLFEIGNAVRSALWHAAFEIIDHRYEVRASKFCCIPARPRTQGCCLLPQRWSTCLGWGGGDRLANVQTRKRANVQTCKRANVQTCKRANKSTAHRPAAVHPTHDRLSSPHLQGQGVASQSGVAVRRRIEAHIPFASVF
jgi:hypothetical protein